MNNELDRYKNKLNNISNDLQNNFNVEIEKLKKEKMDLQNQINYLNNQILTLNNEISNLKKNKNSNLAVINPGEKILSILIKSIDESIELCISCKNIDKFLQLEEQFYEHYPEYKEKNNYFTCNGIVIKRFKTLEENKIKCSDIILLNNE